MNYAYDSIATDFVFGGGIRIGRHGLPFKTKSTAGCRHMPASWSITLIRTVTFPMTPYCTRKPKNRGDLAYTVRMTWGSSWLPSSRRHSLDTELLKEDRPVFPTKSISGATGQGEKR